MEILFFLSDFFIACCHSVVCFSFQLNVIRYYSYLSVIGTQREKAIFDELTGCECLFCGKANPRSVNVPYVTVIKYKMSVFEFKMYHSFVNFMANVMYIGTPQFL